jgi:alpha/beta superfamily hydrolase
MPLADSIPPYMRTRIAGDRELTATRDGTDGRAVVVACPPHPQAGGDRTDSRLQAVSDALPPGMDCLRFDYGPWDEGVGEQADVRAALDWGRREYDRVGLFGFSFGAAVALAAMADPGTEPAAVSVLAPAVGSVGQRVLTGLDRLTCPVQVVYGERDDTADWGPVVERARKQDHTVDAFPGDHFFVGQRARVGECVADFLADTLLDGTQ